MAITITDKQVKDAIADLLQAGSDDFLGSGEPSRTRIVRRWKLSFKGSDWGAVLRSITDSKMTDGWYITRASRHSKKLGTKHWQYDWVYSLWYFRSYRDGIDTSNSEDELNQLLECVAEQFESSPNLGLEEIDRHHELQVANIDLIDQKVHVVQASLTVQITKQ